MCTEWAWLARKSWRRSRRSIFAIRKFESSHPSRQSDGSGNLRSPGKSRGTSGPLTRRVYCRDGALFGPQSGFRISGIGTVQVNQHQSNGRLRTAHSITSSALASNLSETVMPSALAVLRLIIRSALVDCWTGRSDGFSPLRIRPVYPPARRYDSIIPPP